MARAKRVSVRRKKMRSFGQCLSSKYLPWVESGPLVIGHTDWRRADRVQSHFRATSALSYAEEPAEEALLHGKARVWVEPVPGRLRRPPEVGTTPSRAFSLLHRAGARPKGHAVRSPHLRNNALLGRGPSRLGRGGSRVRCGVAEP